MRALLAAISMLFIASAHAADDAPEAKSAEKKAIELEQKKAPADGGNSIPEPAKITRTEAKAVDPDGKKPLDDPITCMARTIYWEAKGESIAGMEAIANVVMNRLGHEGFPDTVCEVVRQGYERGACQFSWWCDGRSDDAQNAKSYELAREIARKALNRQLKDRTGGALYFHQRAVSPQWSAKYIKTVELGAHIFYKPPGRAAK